jgi:hypothetical protein
MREEAIGSSYGLPLHMRLFPRYWHMACAWLAGGSLVGLLTYVTVVTGAFATTVEGREHVHTLGVLSLAACVAWFSAGTLVLLLGKDYGH